MIHLLSAILLSTSILIIFRYFKQYGINNLQAIIVNYVVAASTGFFAFKGTFNAQGIIQASWFPVAILLGLLFIGVFFLFAMSSQKAGVAITAVASRMSVVIPVAGGILLFGDQSGVLKSVGLALALTAIYFILKKKGKTGIKRSALILPLFIFFGAGANDLIMKYAEHHFIEDDLMLFLATIFSISFFIGLAVLMHQMHKRQTKLQWKHLLAGIILGFANFGSTYFLIRSMSDFESSVLFPIVNAGVVSFAALADKILFRELFNWYNWIGIGLAIVSIALISFG
jgi:multidrug transporter EmrE-like cation transporter